MVVYVARCKNIDEASDAQSKLISACPTLIYSRILRKPQDLDVFNSELLRSNDEEIRPGQFDFNMTEDSYESAVKSMSGWIIAGVALLIFGLILALRTLNSPNSSTVQMALIIFSVIAGVGVLATVGAKAISRVSPYSKAIMQANKWLKKGHPVLLAASDNPPDGKERLPKNLKYFDRYPNRPLPYRRTA